MNISYFEPLLWGFRRMKTSLFKPFDIGKWFVVGFSAFLAGLLDGWGGAGEWKWDRYDMDIDRIQEIPYIIRDWISENLEWSVLIALGILLAIVFFVLLTWLSSRGKFLFIENVVRNNTLIKKPWSEYEKEADSLFIWRLFFGTIVFSTILSIIYYGIYYFEELHLLSLIGLAFLLLFIFIVCGYISLFLNDFIVPIMYKNKITTNEAWLKLLFLINENPVPFILYGLFIFVLIILIVICIIIFGFLTCCIGFVFLILPYVGSVFLLPVSYTFRAFSVAFLEQFGSQFILFSVETSEEELHG